MPESSAQPVARLTSPAQVVASLPLTLGYLPTESLVVVCCHEPRGRMGMTMRFDLPRPEHERLLVTEVVRRVRHQRATRVVVAVFTDAADGGQRAGAPLVEQLCLELADLVVTEAVLVRDGRFWSYLCDEPACCPADGTPLDAARESASIRLLEAEQVLRGRAVLPDRAALESSFAGPGPLEATAAAQRCEIASALLADAIEEAGLEVAGELSLRAWAVAVERFRTPPGRLGDMEAAALAVSLVDVWVRDRLAASPEADLPVLQALLEEVARRTPAPYDAPVCTLHAWLTYCQGAGSMVTIALDRALRSDPDYAMAQLLMTALQGQVPPREIRRLTRGRERPQSA